MLRSIILVGFLLAAGAGYAQISSTFNANAQGWTTPNDADGTIGYSATGGNPGGMVFGNPFVIVLGAGSLYVPFNFVAPAAYLGNRSAYYNGTLRYDIQQSSTGTPNQYAEVTIADNAGITLYYFPATPNQPAAAPLWSNYSVVFNNTTGFWKTTNSPTGPVAAETQIQSILSDLATLQIRGLYRDANTTNRLDNVSFTPPIVVSIQPNAATVCNGVTATFTTAATGNPAITYRWQFESSPGVWTDLNNGGGYSNVTTATLSVNTTGNFGAGNYRCRISGTAVVDAFTNAALLTINALPTAPGTTGAARCGTGTVTLTASGGVAGQYRWYTVPTGGTAIAGQTNATYVTPSLTITTPYYVAINNGTCESNRTAVTATINTIPGPPGTTGASACGNSSVTLTATGAAAGQYRWYTLPIGGTAIAGETNATYVTPTLTGTTNYYVSINNGFCESTRTIVTATINTIPIAPSTTGASRCGNGSVTLNASGGVAGQYRWYTVPTGGTAIAGETNATYTTPALTGTTNYYVAINNGICESVRTIVTATINTIPAAPSTTGANRCGSGSVTLNAAGGAVGQYRWYTVPTGGTAIAGETNATYVTPSLAGTTNYYVSINDGTCESNRTIVTATINTIPAAPTTTGGANCGTGTVTLTAAGGVAGQYRWYTVATGGTAIAGQTNNTFVTPAISSTTTYYVSINNGACEGTRSAVVATINTIPSAPTTAGSSSCIAASLTLSAAGGVAGQYRWYTVATGGTAIAGQTSATYLTPLLAITTTFYVSINDGTCESARTPVIATINLSPTPPTTTGASSCGSAALTLSASGAAAGQYRWYTAPTGGTALAGQTNATFTTPLLTATTTYYVAINNTLCESTRTAVVATINTIPGTPTVTAAARCGTGTVTLNAAGGTAGQYRWYTVPTGGTAIAGQTSSSYTTPSISTTTPYYVAINNGLCESPRVLVTATINSVPNTPTTTGAESCPAASVTLTASGGAAGQYRWYTVPTGGTAIAGQTNSTLTTPVLSSTTTYYVAIDNGNCEGPRSPVIATIAEPGCDNVAPVITTEPLVTQVKGVVTISLVSLISDGNDNVDLSTLRIIAAPASGAVAVIDASFNLVIDYSSLSFSGTESITIEVCDIYAACAQQTFSIQVVGEINIFNAISPNNDGDNEIFEIAYIDALENTFENKVSIFNRWGTLVWEGINYNNVDVVFKGLSNSGNELPSGTYFYKIEFKSGKKTESGYLVLKR